MKQTILMICALVAGVGLLPDARAQETTVMPPPGVMPAVVPAVESAQVTVAAATGTIHAVKSPKSGVSSIFNIAGGSSTNGGGMTITSERMEFDYKEMVIAFDENVHVVEPRYDMKSDRMLVFLEGSNQIKRIIAVGKVDLVAVPDRHATCDKAVYDHGRGEIVMTGNPVATQAGNRLVGAIITVLLNEQRIIVDKGRVDLPSETMKHRDLKP